MEKYLCRCVFRDLITAGPILDMITYQVECHGSVWRTAYLGAAMRKLGSPLPRDNNDYCNFAEPLLPPSLLSPSSPRIRARC